MALMGRLVRLAAGAAVQQAGLEPGTMGQPMSAEAAMQARVAQVALPIAQAVQELNTALVMVQAVVVAATQLKLPGGRAARMAAVAAVQEARPTLVALVRRASSLLPTRPTPPVF
jgi:hypothetical protein